MISTRCRAARRSQSGRDTRGAGPWACSSRGAADRRGRAPARVLQPGGTGRGRRGRTPAARVPPGPAAARLRGGHRGDGVTEAPDPAGGPAPQPGSEPAAPSGTSAPPAATGPAPQPAGEPAPPSATGPAPRSSDEPAAASTDEAALLDVRDLRVFFPITRGAVFRRTVGHVHAVDGITLGLAAAETVGLVGESGSGKTTLGRAIVGLIRPTSGTILFRGRALDAKDGGYRAERTQLQMVFQDPTASLDPKWRAGASIAEPLRVNHVGTRDERRRRVRELLEVVGLSPVHARRYPHELSGGQRQRVGLARALALNPAVIIADEAVSALDVSIRAQIINLLQELQRELGLSYLFIAHDLAVVRHLSHRVAVMYLGQIVEQGGAADLYTDPRHPYTVSLLSAVPVP